MRPATETIREALIRRADSMSLREISRQTDVDVSQLSRFARDERQLTTGDGLDRLISFLGLAVTKKGRKR